MSMCSKLSTMNSLIFDFHRVFLSVPAVSKSVIKVSAFCGLGMGIPTVTAARILKGQLNGQSGEETQLEMDKFPFVSLSKV